MALRWASLSRWLPRLLGPAVLAVILSNLDLAAVASALEGIRAAPLAAAGLVVLPTLPLRSWRWRLLVAAGGTKLGAIEAINAYAFSIVVGAATPGRLGELVKIGYLRNKGVPTGAALVSVGLDRVLDLIFLVVVGTGSVAALLGGGSVGVVLAALAAMAGVVVVVLGWAASPRGRRMARTLVSRTMPAAWSRRLTASIESAGSQMRALSAAALAAASLLTALTWIATYVAVYLCTVALGLAVPFLDVCGITAVSSLVTFLPISVLGLGTRDASLIALLAPHGVAAADAVALSALYLGITLWMVMVCAYSLLTPAAVAWKRDPAVEN